MSKRTITLTPAQIEQVEYAYDVYFKVACDERHTIAQSNSVVYVAYQTAFRSIARKVLGITSRDRVYLLMEHLQDNVGFPNSLPRILEHMGYKVQHLHTKDADCTLDWQSVCTGCGVRHDDPCRYCSGRGFHAAADCPTMTGAKA